MDVKLEDQQKINQFSRLNTKLHELEAQLAAKKVRGGGGDAPPLRSLTPLACTQAAAFIPCPSPTASRTRRTWRRRATR